MDIVTKIAPLALALIMLGLGLGLTVKDFKRVLQNPKIFFAKAKIDLRAGLLPKYCGYVPGYIDLDILGLFIWNYVFQIYHT